MNKLVVIYGAVLIASTAIADQRKGEFTVDNPVNETVKTLENELIPLNIKAVTEPTIEDSFVLDLNTVEYVEFEIQNEAQREDALRRHHGDRERAVRHLQTHQGLYILKALADAGFGEMPTVLAYDFRRELARFRRLKARYPRLHWVADTVSADEIHALLASLAQK